MKIEEIKEGIKKAKEEYQKKISEVREIMKEIQELLGDDLGSINIEVSTDDTRIEFYNNDIIYLNLKSSSGSKSQVITSLDKISDYPDLVLTLPEFIDKADRLWVTTKSGSIINIK